MSFSVLILTKHGFVRQIYFTQIFFYVYIVSLQILFENVDKNTIFTYNIDSPLRVSLAYMPFI